MTKFFATKALFIYQSLQYLESIGGGGQICPLYQLLGEELAALFIQHGFISTYSSTVYTPVGWGCLEEELGSGLTT